MHGSLTFSIEFMLLWNWYALAYYFSGSSSILKLSLAKQHTSHIEGDIMNFLQNQKQDQHPMSSYDLSDVVGTSCEEGYIGPSKRVNRDHR